MSSFKKVFTTFNEDVADFFKEKDAKIKVLYEADRVRCYEITLRGRAQCRLLRDDALKELAATSVLDAQRVVARRIAPEILVLTQDGLPIAAQNKDGSEGLLLSRSETLLYQAITSPSGSVPDNISVRNLKTWQDIKELCENVRKEISLIQVIVGYGPYDPLPYKESYQTDLILMCAAQAVTALTEREHERADPRSDGVQAEETLP